MGRRCVFEVRQDNGTPSRATLAKGGRLAAPNETPRGRWEAPGKRATLTQAGPLTVVFGRKTLSHVGCKPALPQSTGEEEGELRLL